ncbi:hypothetical protein [Eisenbergiella tayi]|uniref:hypothetical protein n=1 Tax=Eisenbergiella tayi TaxID=1432052 RepID=UPI0008494578|nr:hypothetical protein [Eisenbergiella tayi]ODR31879.1 hypothetical protein BEI60_29165 [Eisenbergiella tayi]
MSIASGYKKFKKYILTSSGFQLVSHWTKANTLEFDDGKTAQDKLGAIDGISSSPESNSDKIAASTALVSELNSDLGGYCFRINNGIAEYKAGADSDWVPFKKAGFKIPSLYSYVGGSNRMCKLETTFDVTDISTLYIGSVTKYNNGAWHTCTVQGIKADNTKVNLGLKTGTEINVTEYSSVYIHLIPSWDTNQESFVRLTDIRAY